MHRSTCLRASLAASAITVVSMAATVHAPAPTQPQARPMTSQRVQLAAATVPVGGLFTSFVKNQVIYCSIICPLLVDTAVAPAAGAVLAPATFFEALTAGDLLKAIGQTAASVTGPANAAAETAIVADASIPAKRALNALEVGVVGLLRVIPAAQGGLPGVVSAIEAAREGTFIALNLPVVPNPDPTVMPHGVVEVAAVGGLNVFGAVIFTGFNHVLSGVFETPDAIAQELAATGDPLRAGIAGFNAAAGEASAAVAVVADSVVTAINQVSAAARAPATADQAVLAQNPVKDATRHGTQSDPSESDAGTADVGDAAASAAPKRPLRALVSNVRHLVRSALGSDGTPSDSAKSAEEKDNTKAGEGDSDTHVPTKDAGSDTKKNAPKQGDRKKPSAGSHGHSG